MCISAMDSTYMSRQKFLSSTQLATVFRPRWVRESIITSVMSTMGNLLYFLLALALLICCAATHSIEIPNFISKDIQFTDAPFTVSKEGPLLPRPLNELQYHGTTTLAFSFGQSILIAVDSKASVGSYVGSRTVKKVFPISRHILATMAGGAADCAFWIRRTARQAKVLEYEQGSLLRVCGVAKLLAASLREYRGSDLSVGTMVAGFDTQINKPACASFNTSLTDSLFRSSLL